MNVRKKLLGFGRSTSHWFACFPCFTVSGVTREHFAAEWCDAKAGFWDDSVRGSSPLQALRRFVAAQHIDNQEACTVFLMWKVSMIPSLCPWWHGLD